MSVQAHRLLYKLGLLQQQDTHLVCMYVSADQETHISEQKTAHIVTTDNQSFTFYSSEDKIQHNSLQTAMEHLDLVLGANKFITFSRIGEDSTEMVLAQESIHTNSNMVEIVFFSFLIALAICLYYKNPSLFST